MLIKDIFLGLCDYLKDIKHDKILKKVINLGPNYRLQEKVTVIKDDDSIYKSYWEKAFSHKEGNLLHYIKQKRWSNGKHRNH